ncbi:nucleoside monophosphate kinase [Candidatus Purcelliella pentastirinorum]|uniref:Adenylate kinase n=1 Tax=Candidatus Purcelliella pentastirinorum TaxID=472834 RepID=A0AAX3NB25_9ENTR|nr:nucleoside monophosphate kinase [Candidatus Purcelliella pentastirinorum]WDI78733.1 nucleoside monophosphate kinase [Candidatus Purcelliella pentastirinorum]
MNIVLFGAPGVGKGTQAKFISKKYNIKIISTGNILRNEINKNTILGKNISNVINSGKLINDKLITKIIKKYILKKNIKNRILLDGFPRTINQAYSIDNIGLNITCVLELIAPHNTLIERIIGRRIDLSGKIYHIKNIKKKINNSKNKLIIRTDDNIKTAKKRIKTYLKNQKQIIDFYNKKSINKEIKFYKINCNKTIKEINKNISKILDNLKK